MAGCCIEGEGKTSVLVRANGLQLLPNSMPLVGMLLVQVFLRFKWNPALRPQGLFLRVGDAVKPVCWERLVRLGFVPFAQPEHMLGCGWDMAEWTRGPFASR